MKRHRAGYVDFIGIPRRVADSSAFKSLPPLARALYVDLRRQHNGHNNGHIAAVMQGTGDRPGLAHYGWPARTVFKFLKMLLEHGLIERTRQGGIGAMSKTCTLYGFTDLAIIANKEKGVPGSMPSLAFLCHGEPEKQIAAAHHAAIAAPGAPTQLHVVPTTTLTTAPRAASNFRERVT